MVEEKLKELLEEKFTEPEFNDCFVVELTYNPASKKIVVYIDSDSALSYVKCGKVSRHLEAYLDESGVLGEKYTLDVSSPGIGRPLKFYRQYPKNVGRKVELVLLDGGKQKGKLIDAKPEALTLEVEKKIKVGKKNKKVIESLVFPFDSIEKTIVKISF